MWINVDPNEASRGLAELLRASWDLVGVRRLRAGDVAIGARILIERKTAEDFIASLDDGRLFRQARQLVARADRPVVILEGEAEGRADRIKPGAHRGALLALSVGFRIPVLNTNDLAHTARVIRHMAAQESRRESRRRQCRGRAQKTEPPPEWAPEAFEVLESLPGVGHVRAASLARHIRSLTDLSQLGVRELLEVPGIGPDTAARIIDVLRGRQSGTESAART